jgi:hypothetical protein
MKRIDSINTQVNRKGFLRSKKSNGICKRLLMRSKLLGLILLSGSIFFPVESLFSQSNSSISLVHPNIVPVTPEAAAMERYVNYPVSYSTGIPDINIPLYEIKVGDITLPISLSYHAAGLKPHEYSGWVGTGWTLNAEPSVMRNIQGIPDDDESRQGYNFHNFRDYDLFANTSDGKKNMRDMIDLRKYDENPDRFTFKLANESGNFYLTEGKGLLIHPAQDIEITKGSISRKDFPDFTIVNKRGIKYFFGGENDYYERTGNYITRWMCKEISSPTTRAKISFEYNSCTRDISSNIPNHYVIIEDQISNATVAYLTDFRDGSHYRYTISENNTLTNLSTGTNYQTAPRPYTSNALSEKKPSAIRFDNGSVIFEAYSCQQLYIRPVAEHPYDKDDQGDYRKGLLSKVENYANDSLVAQTEYEYTHAKNYNYRIRIAKPYRKRTVEFNRSVPSEDEFINSNDNELYIRDPWYLDTGWMNLTKETVRTFSPGGKEVISTKEYTYTEKYEWGLDIGIDGNEDLEIRDCWYPIKIKTYGSTDIPIYDRYLYSGTHYAKAFYDIPYMHFYPEYLAGDTYIRDDIIEHRRITGTDTAYVRKKYNGIYPELIKTKLKPGPDFDVRLQYHQYDSYGNVADVSDAGGKHTCYIWSYNNQHPLRLKRIADR